MSAVAWLAKSLFESLTGLWPLVVVAILALILPARVLWQTSADTRRAMTRRAQKGWWFPLVLIVFGLLLSPFDTGSTRGSSIVTTVVLLGIPLLHIAWMVIA